MTQHNDYLQKFAGSIIIEDDTMARAREYAEDLNIVSISPEAGAFLSVAARLSGGKSIVEVGTGGGISGLWLLSGMVRSGVLTTIDKDPDMQQAAKENFTRAGIAQGRARFINGWSEEVLPRLSDSTYDIVFIDAVVAHPDDLIVNVVRILRPGGSLLINTIGAGADKAPGFAPEEKSFALDTLRAIARDDALMPSFIPLDKGILAVVKDPLPEEGK